MLSNYRYRFFQFTSNVILLSIFINTPIMAQIKADNSLKSEQKFNLIKNFKDSKILPLTYIVKKIKKTSHLNQEAYFDYSCPVFSGSKIVDIINKDLAQNLLNNFLNEDSEKNFSTIEEFASNYIDDYNKNVFGLDENIGPYFSKIICSVVFNNSGILSIGVEFSQYSGGPHPNILNHNFVYDVKTGQRILFEDIFDASKNEELKQIINNKFRVNYREINNLKPNEKIDEEDFLYYQDSVENNYNNFIINERGIVFFFNTSSSYAVGTRDMDLNWDELKYLLKK